jgi:hypothetical protein
MCWIGFGRMVTATRPVSMRIARHGAGAGTLGTRRAENEIAWRHTSAHPLILSLSKDETRALRAPQNKAAANETYIEELPAMRLAIAAPPPLDSNCTKILRGLTASNAVFGLVRFWASIGPKCFT